MVFRYRQHVETHGDEAPIEYGLIAEEVAEVFPELVVYDEEGRPETVKYHLLSSMLLNEVQKLSERVEAQDESIRHMGPMAQDFHDAFGLGVSDKLIDTIDPDGVALAAIQGLRAIVRDNEERLAEKDGEINELRARLDRLEALVR